MYKKDSILVVMFLIIISFWIVSVNAAKVHVEFHKCSGEVAINLTSGLASTHFSGQGSFAGTLDVSVENSIMESETDVSSSSPAELDLSIRSPFIGDSNKLFYISTEAFGESYAAINASLRWIDGVPYFGRSLSGRPLLQASCSSTDTPDSWNYYHIGMTSEIRDEEDLEYPLCSIAVGLVGDRSGSVDHSGQSAITYFNSNTNTPVIVVEGLTILQSGYYP